MSVREVTMYAAACDRCGKHAEYGGEYVAWAEPEGAVQSFVYFALPAWAEIEVLSGQPEADR